MTKLSVNINKIATIRNARGGNTPNLLQVALDCEKFGAEGITVHPRPDERHIRYADVRELKPLLTTEFNIEGYPCKSFIDLVTEVKPAQVTLVPDPPEALTSNAGWDTIKNKDFLIEVVSESPENRSVVRIGCNVQALLGEGAGKLNSNTVNRGVLRIPLLVLPELVLKTSVDNYVVKVGKLAVSRGIAVAVLGKLALDFSRGSSRACRTSGAGDSKRKSKQRE